MSLRISNLKAEKWKNCAKTGSIPLNFEKGNLMETFIYLDDQIDWRKKISTIETADICCQVCDHIIGLISYHLGNENEGLKSLKTALILWQFQLRILGTIAFPGDSNTDTVKLRVARLYITTMSLDDDDNTVHQEYEHELSQKDFSQICPDTLLDFMQVLAENSINNLKEQAPDTLNYLSWADERLQVGRELLLQMRRLCTKISDVPNRDSNTVLVSPAIGIEIL